MSSVQWVTDRKHTRLDFLSIISSSAASRPMRTPLVGTLVVVVVVIGAKLTILTGSTRTTNSISVISLTR